MGTRNLTLIYQNGQYVADKYCQWDGYLESAGVKMLEVLKSINLDTLRKNLGQLQRLKEKQIKDLWVECGAKPGDDWVDMGVSEKMKTNYPQFQRDMSGYEFVKGIADGSIVKIPPSEINFAADSLFCEYAYVVDLDANTFEIFKGFNTTPLQDGGRFKFLGGPNNGGYYPVQLFTKFELDNLPSKAELLALDKDSEEEVA